MASLFSTLSRSSALFSRSSPTSPLSRGFGSIRSSQSFCRPSRIASASPSALASTSHAFSTSSIAQSSHAGGRLKSHQGAKKRWTAVGHGLFKRAQCGRRHLNVGMPSSRLNRLGKNLLAPSGRTTKTLKRLLGPSM